jgi:hypothetical protein
LKKKVSAALANQKVSDNDFKKMVLKILPQQQLFDAHAGDTDYSFSKTTIPLSQMTSSGALVSRSEAKRLCEQLAGFTNVILDFTGIEWIGQGFADQVFRVYHNTRPDCQLVPVNANAAVSNTIF